MAAGQRPAVLRRRWRADGSRLRPGRRVRARPPVRRRAVGARPGAHHARHRPALRDGARAALRPAALRRRVPRAARRPAPPNSLPVGPVGAGRPGDRPGPVRPRARRRSAHRSGLGPADRVPPEPRRVAHPQRRLGGADPPPLPRGVGPRRARVHVARPVADAPRRPPAQRCGAHRHGSPDAVRPDHAGLLGHRRAAPALRGSRRHRAAAGVPREPLRRVGPLGMPVHDAPRRYVAVCSPRPRP